MQKKWLTAMASICCVTFLFSGCGFYQTDHTQENTQGTRNQSKISQTDITDKNRNEWTRTGGDRWNRAPYAVEGRGETFKRASSVNQREDVLWGDRTNYSTTNQSQTMSNRNLSEDITDEVRGWGNPHYARYQRNNEPNTNIWGPQRGAIVPEWTPEGQVYKIKKSAPYMERKQTREDNRIPMGSR
ncbi:hypothetical protein [Ammoniphilus sp. CFH 90114]|uniref:hypothetical protein n=1 Tax=Ammoniphilus sp. CFH 90114 TaxID=2493665 RepID=UPI00100DCC05|nr:hypothetical protein [Ammoniphilus sp. CFH 90114]RXT15301.1 hypothetical protein EIZ39_03585 [Ammoniphilus sp. CFH 90114]